MRSFLPVCALLLVIAVSCQGEETCPSAEILVITRAEVRKEIQQQLSKVRNHPTDILQCNYTDLRRDIEKLADQNEQILARIDSLYERGSSHCNPASSCKEIYDKDPERLSGYYWIEDEQGASVRKYCDMTRTCGGITGGWTRVVLLDMRHSTSECPSGLRERQHPGQRLCGMNINGASCSHAYFAVDGIQYKHVCGKIIAYQFGSPDSFGLHPPNQIKSIDENYLDGISLTYGRYPRKHIWSFAAALDEVSTFQYDNCPCTNVHTAGGASLPPSFVGNDYFCDTASANRYKLNHLYTDDPLWDGAGCGSANTCCSLNNPPWFFKQLPFNTHDDIEMRICGNENRQNEDVRVEQIEIYIQ